MSRIGKQPIAVAGATVTIADGIVSVCGTKGTVSVPVHPRVRVTQEGDALRVTVVNPKLRDDRALWGLTARLLQNAMTGVSKGFTKQLEIHGVGFRGEVKGTTIEFALGFSHPVQFTLPRGITATMEKNVLTLQGVDRQLVGETAARIHRLRKPDAYHGKGIRYAGQVLKLKPGKAAKTGAAAK